MKRGLTVLSGIGPMSGNGPTHVHYRLMEEETNAVSMSCNMPTPYALESSIGPLGLLQDSYGNKMASMEVCGLDTFGAVITFK